MSETKQKKQKPLYLNYYRYRVKPMFGENRNQLNRTLPGSKYNTSNFHQWLQVTIFYKVIPIISVERGEKMRSMFLYININ